MGLELMRPRWDNMSLVNLNRQHIFILYVLNSGWKRYLWFYCECVCVCVCATRKIGTMELLHV